MSAIKDHAVDRVSRMTDSQLLAIECLGPNGPLYEPVSQELYRRAVAIINRQKEIKNAAA